MAKRSATECAGVLDVCRKLELLEESRYLNRERVVSADCINSNQDDSENWLIGKGAAEARSYERSLIARPRQSQQFTLVGDRKERS